MTAALRQRQIREVLDEDLRANREVLYRSFKQARVFEEEYKPPNKLEELVSWNIDKLISNLEAAIQNVINGAIDNQNMGITNEDISHIKTTYNLLVSYLQNYSSRFRLTQRDKAEIDAKFKDIEPILNQVKQILQHPAAYNVDVNAQNLHIVEHIDQQIQDGNYHGLSMLNYKRIPASNTPLRRALNYRGYMPPLRPRPNNGGPADDDDDDDDGSSPRPRNQTALSTSSLVQALASRQGGPAASPQPPPLNPKAKAPLLTRASSVGGLQLSPSTPLVLPASPNEAATTVNTLGQMGDSRGFFSRGNKVAPSAAKAPPTPIHAMPTVSFNKAPKGFATVNGKRVLDKDGSLISDVQWKQLHPTLQGEYIQQALSGNGKPALLYESDRNNLWRD